GPSYIEHTAQWRAAVPCCRYSASTWLVFLASRSRSALRRSCAFRYPRAHPARECSRTWANFAGMRMWCGVPLGSSLMRIDSCGFADSCAPDEDASPVQVQRALWIESALEKAHGDGLKRVGASSGKPYSLGIIRADKLAAE